MELDILKWRLSKMRRRLRRKICGALYRDLNADTRKSILIAGTGRSGTTWLADIIASSLHSRIVFEPFYPAKVEAYGRYNYFQYMRPEENDDDLRAYCEKVFMGAIRNEWVDAQVEYLRPKGRVVKEIRANLFLRWIHDRFPEIPIFFIVRHPCAVVHSRMSLNWATESDIRPFLSQDSLVRDFLSDNMDFIERATTPEEKHAIIWCVSNLVPLRQFPPRRLNVVFYEDLCTRPQDEIARVFQLLGRSPDGEAFRHAARASITATRNSSIVHGGDRLANWETKVTPGQRDRILRVVERFALDHLYGCSLVPQIDVNAVAI